MNGFLFSVQFLPVKRTSSSLDSHLKVVEIHIYKGDDRHLYETGNHEVKITNVLLCILCFWVQIVLKHVAGEIILEGQDLPVLSHWEDGVKVLFGCLQFNIFVGRAKPDRIFCLGDLIFHLEDQSFHLGSFLAVMYLIVLFTQLV